MKRKTQLKAMMYVLIMCIIFTFTVSLLFGMEVVTGLPRYSMESSILGMFVFLAISAGFMLGLSICSQELSKL